jgi:hypothetical protein
MNPENSSTAGPEYGALVISLDFELHWGVRDTERVDGPYRANLLGARKAIPRMLDIFEEFEAGVTWATVGFLFARSREELEAYSPAVRAAYQNRALDPYSEHIGANEEEDPLHFAPSLIEEIRRRPRQEIGTHTFSHFYCREAGQTAQDFREDLRSAVAIAARSGICLSSIVFPRNQYLPEHAPIVRDFGITSYRGTERHWMYQAHSSEEQRIIVRRGARILDNYLNLTGSNVTHWGDILQDNGLFRIPSSRILRPYYPSLSAIEPLRLKRILSGIEAAARSRGVFHINWHPHNFGINLDENMQVLRSILECYARQRDNHGMRSLSMQEVVATLKASEQAVIAA